MSSMPSATPSPAPGADVRPTEEPELSVVIPVCDEELTLPALIERTLATCRGMSRSFELILVNDGSRDASPQILREAATREEELVVINFNRNYGQHAAVYAGFQASRGEIVVTLDADLQNPPEEIPRLVEKMAEGFDVVGSVRAQRRDSLPRRLASRLMNRVTCHATGAQLSDYGCMLRAYRRKVVDALCELREISTFVPVLADMFARRVTEITVAHCERSQGSSKYGLLQLIRLQFDLLTGFTLLPLRLTMGLGVVMSVLSFGAALALAIGRLFLGAEWAASGVFTLFAGVFFFLGVLLFSVGLLGEYVGRIYMVVRRRPRYVIREVLRSATPGPGT